MKHALPRSWLLGVLGLACLASLAIFITILLVGGTARRSSAYSEGVIQALQWCSCMTTQEESPVNRTVCDRQWPLPGIPIPPP